MKSSLFYLFIWLILSLIQQTLFFHYSLFPSLNTLRQDTAILICPPKLMLLILLLNVSRRLDTSSIPLFLDRVSRVQLNNPNYTQSSTYQYSTPKATHCSYQRPKNHRGIVALPSGKFLRVRKVFARNHWNCTGKFPYGLESFQISWKVSGLSRKCPDGLGCFGIILKISK